MIINIFLRQMIHSSHDGPTSHLNLTDLNMVLYSLTVVKILAVGSQPRRSGTEAEPGFWVGCTSAAEHMGNNCTHAGKAMEVLESM